MKLWKCDKCGTEKGTSQSYPKDWFLINVFSRPSSKGGRAKGYHFCKKCKGVVFGK